MWRRGMATNDACYNLFDAQLTEGFQKERVEVVERVLHVYALERHKRDYVEAHKAHIRQEVGIGPWHFFPAHRLVSAVEDDQNLHGY